MNTSHSLLQDFKTAIDLQRAASEQIRLLNQQLLDHPGNSMESHDQGGDRADVRAAAPNTVHHVNQPAQPKASAAAEGNMRWLQRLWAKAYVGVSRIQHYQLKQQHSKQQDQGQHTPVSDQAAKGVLPTNLTTAPGLSPIQVHDDAFGTLMQWLHAKMLQKHPDHSRRHFKVHVRHPSPSNAHQT
jgi:hypothetical protein